MRALRERPRVALASVVGLVMLVGLGALAGVAVSDRETEVPSSVEVRLASAEQGQRDKAKQLREERLRVTAAREDVDDLAASNRRLDRANAKLRRELKATRRALRRARARD